MNRVAALLLVATVASVLIGSTASGGGNVLISGVEMDATIQGYLTAQGYTSTIVAPSAFGSASFAGYDAIWLGWYSTFSGLASRQTDLIDFMNGGGNVLAELTHVNGNPLSDYPFAGAFTFTSVDANPVHIVAPLSPLMAGLTDSSLSNWGNSYHGLLGNIGGFTGVADNGTAGQWITVTEAVGLGNLIYTTQDASFHLPYTNSALVLVDNALSMPLNAVEAVPEPSAILGWSVMSVLGFAILRRRTVRPATAA